MTSQHRAGPEERWTRSAAALWRRTFDRTVLLDWSTGATFNLSATGAAIWDMLEVPASATELARELAPLYEVDVATVERDVRALLEQLHGMQVVTRA